MQLPELPPSLAAGLDALLDVYDRRRLEAAATRLSETYRGREEGASRAARTAEDVAAYAAYRAPATFAAVEDVLRRIATQRPDWRPGSVLDVGAGPGIASWAAAAVWPEIERFTLVEAEPEMIALGQRLAVAAPTRPLATAQWVSGDAAVPGEPADLVLASYVLGELRDVDQAVRRLWERAADTLVLVEPGTPAGYARVIEAREGVLAAGGFTLAPCPHDTACPLTGGDWCHFAVRLSRGEAHRVVKGVSRGFEDEKLSYAALSRSAAPRPAARIIRPPLVRSGHIHLDTCEAGGLAHRIVSRRDKDAFRAARKAGWGDTMDVDTVDV